MSMKMEGKPLHIRDVSREPLAGSVILGLAGDLIFLRPVVNKLKSQHPELVAELERADVLFGNLETSLFDLDTFQGSPQAQSGGTWMFGGEDVAWDLKSLGFSVLGLANNHATDWGVEGLNRTRELIAEVGLAQCGAGRSMSQARTACYQDIGGGRVAFLAASATFTPNSPAADPLGQVPGRPGINVLRTLEYSALHPDDYSVLVGLARSSSYSNNVRDSSLRLMGGEFVPDERVPQGSAEVRHIINEDDREAILLQIRQARQNSNLVVFSYHSHEPDNGPAPAHFSRAFCQEAVVAGADVVVSHGPHQLRGIEQYRDGIIFHSLGNFSMMTHNIGAINEETYRLYNVDPSATTVPEVVVARNEQMFGESQFSESVLPLMQYEGGELYEIELVPLDLGHFRGGANKGVPSVATGSVREGIFSRLQSLSSPFDTELEVRGGRGFVRLR